MLIEDKRTMLGLLQKGRFGNTMRTWETPSQVPLHLRDQEFGIRSRKVGSTSFVNHLSYAALERAWTDSPDNYVSESIAEDDIIAHVELSKISKSEPGWWLQWNTGSNHRAAMRNGFTVLKHAQALGYLQDLIGQDNYDLIMGIFEEFDLYEKDLTVEFTYLRRAVGTEPNRMVIWEVRHY